MSPHSSMQYAYILCGYPIRIGLGMFKLINCFKLLWIDFDDVVWIIFRIYTK